MSRSLKRSAILLLCLGLLAVPIVSWSQTPAAAPASQAKLQPLTGKLPPFCETCGTVIAINRITAKEAALRAPAASTPGAGNPAASGRFEVVVRLSAGTQQVITYDAAPQLVIGQKVRITDGVIIPELG